MGKTFKTIGWIVMTGVVLLFGTEWWLEGKIGRRAGEKLYEATGGRIKADIGNVNVSLLQRKVQFEEVVFTTDTSKALIAGNPLEYAEARIRKLTVKGIHYDSEDSLLILRARTFELDVPEAVLAGNKVADWKFTEKTDSTTQQAIRLTIGKFELRSGEVSYEQHTQDDTVSYRVKGLRWQMNGCGMNSSPDTLHPRYFCQDMRISSEAFLHRFARGSQLLQADSLYLDSQTGRVTLGQIALLPRYPMEEFAAKSPGHTDWTKITTGKITLCGWNMQRLVHDSFLATDSIVLEGAQIASFKNRQIEQPKRAKRLFYQSVQQFPIRFAVHRTRLKDINVEYSELLEKGDTPGKITFNGLNGLFTDLTNVPTAGQTHYTLRASGKLMNRGRMEATFRLPVAGTDDHFSVEGRLGTMSITDLNPMIEPLTKIKVISGEVESLNFRITGNARQSQTDLLFLYEDLKVRLLKEKDGEVRVRSFLTDLANGILLIKSNPGSRGERKAEATADRAVYRPQFNYLWRSIVAGLKKTIGL